MTINSKLSDNIPPLKLREYIAKAFIVGDGIEIGALNNPLPVPATVRVRYVDRMHVDQLRSEQYPELSDQYISHVDIIDDCELLELIPDGSCDFVISNHVIEHCKHTIKALETWFRVLKPGGVLFMTVPDKRFTFDIDRPLTTLEHVIEDYSRPSNHYATDHYATDHYYEYVRLVDKVTVPDAFNERMRYLIGIDYSIHFHVWTHDTFCQLLDHVRLHVIDGIEVLLDIEDNRFENLFIILKVQ